MNTELLQPSGDIANLKQIAERAFGGTDDSSIAQWFSFDEMVNQISLARGVCATVALDDVAVGFVYAQQESPINGPEGTEKWVIVITAVDPEFANRGAGKLLLTEIEKAAHKHGATKLFVYTNEGDDDVISFYRGSGYQEAGRVSDYQYGKGNSAVFLLKWL